MTPSPDLAASQRWIWGDKTHRDLGKLALHLERKCTPEAHLSGNAFLRQ